MERDKVVETPHVSEIDKLVEFASARELAPGAPIVPIDAARLHAARA